MGNNYVSDTGWRNTQVAGKLYEKLKDSVKFTWPEEGPFK